jgi:hypothetical protein
MKTLYNKMGHGGKMKYAGGGRMSNPRLARMLAKYMMGGKKKYEHGGAHFDAPLNTQSDQNERYMVRSGQASSATPGEGATIAFGEGSPVDFKTVLKSYIEKNSDMVNPGKDFYMVGDERVFFDQGDDDAMQRLVLKPANEREVGQTQGDTYMAVYNDLMSEFDNYVAGFGDEVKNDPKAIERMRKQFQRDAQNYAGQIADARDR